MAVDARWRTVLTYTQKCAVLNLSSIPSETISTTILIPQISSLSVSISPCREQYRLSHRDERNVTSALKGFGSGGGPGQAERRERGCRCISTLSATYKSLQKSSKDMALEAFPPDSPSFPQKKQAFFPPSKLCLMCNVSLAKISWDLNKSSVKTVHLLSEY